MSPVRPSGRHGDRGLQPRRGDRPIAGRNRTKRRRTSSNSNRSTIEPPPQYAQPAPAPAAAPDPIEQLTKLAELKNQGILTDAEFQAQKAEILAS